jgi:hypothetical protein
LTGPLSATTIYGSTAVCSPVGKFTTCIDAGSGTFSGALQGDYLVVGTTAASSGGVRLGTQVAIRARNVANTANIPLIESTASDGVSVSNGALILTSTGAATFSSTDLNSVSVTNPTTTGITTGSGIGFKAYNGTSVTQFGGIFLTSNSWSYGTYSAQQLSIGADGTGGLALRSANSAPITFFTGGASAGDSTERIRITAAGCVGIGQTSPSYLLDLKGCGTPLRIVNTCSSVNQLAWIKLRQADNTNFGADIGIDTTTGGDFVIGRNNNTDTFTEAFRITRSVGNAIFQGSIGLCSGGAINMTIPNGNNGGSIRMVCCTGANEGDMYFTGGGAVGILIAGSGKIGIGTTTPQSTLHIGPSLNSMPAATSIAVPGDTSIRFMAGSDGNANYGSFIGGTQVSGVRALSLGSRQGDGDIVTMTLTQGCVGIGCTTPYHKLHIKGTEHYQLGVYDSAASIKLGADDNTMIGMNMRNDTSGIDWFIGNHDPGASGIQDRITFARLASGGSWSFPAKLSSAGALTILGGLTQNASDIRLKTNICNIPNAINKITSLNGFTYNWNELASNLGPYCTNIKQIGVSAQDVQSVLPEAVFLAGFDVDSDDDNKSKSGQNYLTIQYEKLVPLLIEGMKEQQCTIQCLMNRIVQLENK